MFSGVFKKMISIHDDPVRYILDFGNDLLFLNQSIGKNFKIQKTGYCCLSCQDNIEIFANGFCKKCFFESPMSGDWVMKPELSKAHLDIQDRDLEYEKKIQLQDHIVYLSKTSGVKVGVTRSNNKTTRWIDQGAIEAIELIEVPNRYLAGIAEVKLKDKFSDKTKDIYVWLAPSKTISILFKLGSTPSTVLSIDTFQAVLSFWLAVAFCPVTSMPVPPVMLI